MRRVRFALIAAAIGVVAMMLPVRAVLAESTLDTVKSRGTLVAGVRFDAPPYGYVDADGKNVGIDIDIADEIAKRLGVRVQFIQVTGESRIPTLLSGKADILLADLTHTRAREQAIDFSITYVLDGIGVMVKKAGAVHDLSDLNGRTVSAVQGASVIYPPLKKVAPEARVIEFPEYPQAFLAFQQGLADAFCGDASILDKFYKSAPGEVEMLRSYLAPEPIAIGLRKNDSDWRNKLNGLLQDMVIDGTWEKIMTKRLSVPISKPEVFP
jgi:ABC-type amino acid transport substrate-binding protein